MEKLKTMIQDFRISRGWDKTDTDEILVKSIVVEAAELLECYQFTSTPDKKLVKGEVSDVLMYALSLCYDNGWNPKDIIEEKLVDVAARYPKIDE